VVIDGDIGDPDPLRDNRVLTGPRQIQNEGLGLTQRAKHQQTFDDKQSAHQ
jgi:hypothetical protein